MGREIPVEDFAQEDFQRFHAHLQEETELLRHYLEKKEFDTQDSRVGLELEAWLVDDAYQPAPMNEQYLAYLNDPKVVPELARFNVELNTTPQDVDKNVLTRLHRDLEQTWRNCRAGAEHFGGALLMTGILPTLQNAHLIADNMSKVKRYYALNTQVFKQRRGRPLHLEISGREHLSHHYQDVMLESATTSLQIHLQVSPEQGPRLFNTALFISAPMVAAAANSPFLFGRDLWDETRIPVFEQAVEVGGYAGAARGPLHRVGFGSAYAQDSLLECFQENLEHFPVLLPVSFSEPHSRFPHLRLHNGTIWRWNRPLVDFIDEVPHFRIEHRVVPSGPSILDVIANIAFFLGLMQYYGDYTKKPVARYLDFSQVRENFYAAARYGLSGSLLWVDGGRQEARRLLLKEFLPAARLGLEQGGIEGQNYLDIIEQRVTKERTGAAWQRAFVQHYGRDMQTLARAYAERCDSGLPVHEWGI